MSSQVPDNHGVELRSQTEGLITQHAVPVKIHTPQRTIAFCSVTESEIEVYASTGWAVNILLTLVGAFGGFALGCLVALMQGGLQPEPEAAIKAAAWVSGITTILFLLLAGAVIWMQTRVRRPWKASIDSIDDQ